MACLRPRTVGFKTDGKTITYRERERSKDFAPFKLPCGKCLECRLSYAREWAIRCVHESKLHEKNSFITLTYSDEKLPADGRLHYRDFQLFMKKVRKTQNDPIGVFVTGEYGDRTKRPHWHAILFNFEPKDSVLKRTTDRGDRVFSSLQLDKLWGNGITEFGSVTLESAGYCARYAAKKLAHGKDDTHDYLPISKKSSKHAVGKKWLEKFWPDIFLHGKLVLPSGETCPIPRYYEKWLKENKPEEWRRYVTGPKVQKIEYSEKLAAAEAAEEMKIRIARSAIGEFAPQRTAQQSRELILKSKFKTLQDHLKL